jgi:spore maturation protein CgeB
MSLNIVVLGLSITSSWANGHATTYRALLKAVSDRGHSVTFLERDVPWYRDNRDLERAAYCRIELYGSLPELARQYGKLIGDADLIILGSYVPDGVAIGEWLTSRCNGLTAFYDIDTPVTLQGLQDGSVNYLSPRLVPRFGIYLSFTGGPALRIIEERYGSPMARALYCSAELPAQVRTIRQRWSLGYLGTYSEDRQRGVDGLLLEAARQLPDHHFAVAGSKYPPEIDWPANLRRMEHLPPAEHPDFFSAQRFTLNVTRPDMKALGFSPSVRMFEAAACGTPLISDNWKGIEAAFKPGVEILTAEDTRDVIGILTEMSDETRLTIAANARARFRKDHTAAHRATQLENYYYEALAHRRSIRTTRGRHFTLQEAK